MADDRVPTDLERRVHDAMLTFCRRANSERGYDASDLLGIVSTNVGLRAPQDRLCAPQLSVGFTGLRPGGRLDLSAEFVIAAPTRSALITDEDRSLG